LLSAALAVIAKGGTPLMRADQQIGIDLPLKLLAWQDNAKAWLTYNDPNWITQRYNLGLTRSTRPCKTRSGALAAISKEATT